MYVPTVVFKYYKKKSPFFGIANPKDHLSKNKGTQLSVCSRFDSKVTTFVPSISIKLRINMKSYADNDNDKKMISSDILDQIFDTINDKGVDRKRDDNFYCHLIIKVFLICKHIV